MAEQDPFFKALHNSFQSETGLNEPTFGSSSLSTEEPSLKSYSSLSANENVGLSFANSDFIKNSNTDFSVTSQSMEKPKENLSPLTGLSDFAARLAAVRGDVTQTTPNTETSFSEPVVAEPQISASVENKNNDDEDEDLVYPFGGWGNEAGNDK